MRIDTDPKLLVSGGDHPLWYIVSAPSFAQDCLACGPSGYESYYGMKMKHAQGRTRVYSFIAEGLFEVFEAKYQAKSVCIQNQSRIQIPGRSNTLIRAIVRKGRPVPDENWIITAGKNGRATEELSLWTEQSLSGFENQPFNVGLAFFYDESDDGSDAIEMWLAHRWKSKKGSKRIYCEECVYLGKIPFNKKPKTPRVPISDVPVID